MKTKHMPEPWRLEMGIMTASDGTLFMQQRDKNTQRILACVNAMEGIDNPKKFRENWEAIKHLELDKYQNLKEVIQNMVDRLDEGVEMTLTKDSIIVLALKEAIK